MFHGDFHKEVLEKLNKIILLLEKIEHNTHKPTPHGVKFFYKGKPMADLVLNQGQSAPVELHFVDAAGNDLGLVPVTSNPSISSGDPSTLGVSISGSTAVVSNVNTGSADVDDSLNGSAGGFTTTATVTCKGTGTGGGPQPAGVKFVFGTPTP